MIRRLISALAAACLALLGCCAPSLATEAVARLSISSYSYYPNGHPAAFAHGVSERGPPAVVNGATNDAVDRWSPGALVRLESAALFATISYDTPSTIAESAQATGPTREQSLGDEDALSSFASATVVAANTANTASRLLSPSSLADEVANATGGVLKTNKGAHRT